MFFAGQAQLWPSVLSFPIMKTIALRAHFDGEHIQLDEPCDLAPDTPVMIIVRPEESEDERDEWRIAAGLLLANAYGEDEPEYPLELIKESNPDYEGR
jgi:hypothetical protein